MRDERWDDGQFRTAEWVRVCCRERCSVHNLDESCGEGLFATQCSGSGTTVSILLLRSRKMP